MSAYDANEANGTVTRTVDRTETRTYIRREEQIKEIKKREGDVDPTSSAPSLLTSKVSRLGLPVAPGLILKASKNDARAASLPPALQIMLKELTAHFGYQAFANVAQWTITPALEEIDHLRRVAEWANSDDKWHARLVREGKETFVFSNFCQNAREIARDYGRKVGRYKEGTNDYIN